MASTFRIEDVSVIGESDKAIRVTSPNLDSPEWIPKTQVHDDSEVWQDGHFGDLVVTEWIAQQKGWL